MDKNVWFWTGVVSTGENAMTDVMSDDFTWIDGTPFVYNTSYMNFNPLYRDTSTVVYCTQLSANVNEVNRFGFHNRRSCSNNFGFMCQFDCASGV